MAKKEKNPTPPDNEAKSEGDSTEASAPAKGGKMKLILIVVAAVVIGAGGAVAALTFLGGSGGAPEESAAVEESVVEESTADGAGHGGGEAAEAEPAGPQNIEFKPFIVNLNDAGGKRYLKLTMSVDVDTEALGQEINSKMPMFRDTILLLLSSLSYDDIATTDGKMRLRNQMLNRINTQLTSGKIRNIYFAEFVVQ